MYFASVTTASMSLDIAPGKPEAISNRASISPVRNDLPARARHEGDQDVETGVVLQGAARPVREETAGRAGMEAIHVLIIGPVDCDGSRCGARGGIEPG